MSVPKHIAIIMDGNGRWAKKKGLPRNAGHTAGAKNVENIMAQYFLNMRVWVLNNLGVMLSE